MFAVVLSLLVFASARANEQISQRAREIRAINELQLEMANFRNAIGKIDDLMMEIRDRRTTPTRRESSVHETDAEILDATRSWYRMQEILSGAREAGLNLSNPLNQRLKLEQGTLTLLAIDKNTRFGTASPMPLLVRYWLGLQYGEKIATLPKTLRQRFSIETKPKYVMTSGNILLAMMPNGGAIRGDIEGWLKDGRIVIREVLPPAFHRQQVQDGSYRVFDPMQASRLEVMKVSPDLISSLPAPIVTGDGDYVKTYLRSGQLSRIELQLSDMEALESARTGKKPVQAKPSISVVDSLSALTPRYTPVSFLRCEGAL